MSKKILFCSLFILIFLMPSKQDSNAETWERHNTTVSADSILAAIDRGDSIIIDRCKIFGSLKKEGTPEKLETIMSLIKIYISTFSDPISFSHCYFTKGIGFEGDNLNGYSSFWFTTFGDYADFDRTKFGGDVNFMGTTFGGNASFFGATFSGDVDFRFAHFGRDVDLAFIEFKNIYILWKQLKGHLICEPRVSYKLMKQFEEERHLDDADGIYLFLKDHERMEKKWYVRYPAYWFIQLTCGYGRKPLNTFILSIILVVLFAVFFTNSKAIKEIEKESGRRWLPRLYRDIPKTRRKRFYYALYFSLHTFIIGVVSDWHATDEFLIKRMIEIKLFKFGPNIKLTPRFKFRTLSMMEGALGWILVIILIISLERTIGR